MTPSVLTDVRKCRDRLLKAMEAAKGEEQALLSYIAAEFGMVAIALDRVISMAKATYPTAIEIMESADDD